MEEESIVLNGMQPKDDEMKWNHKKRAKDRFLLFCETVLNHERELLTETLNSSSQESINENRAPEGQINSSIENSIQFNSDSDGANNGEISINYTNDNEDGDSFNSVTCFCGKPFAGRPMIECSGCLTWLHMSCVKVKRKNIPEFYYCDNCKSSGLLSPSSNTVGTASSGEETPVAARPNGTLSSNIISTDGILYSNNAHQNQNTTKPRKPKTVKKSSVSLISDNIKNNSSSDSKYLTKKSTMVNGKLKKIRQSTKKIRPVITSPPPTLSKTISQSSLAAAASLTALSLNNHVSPPGTANTTSTITANNGIASNGSVENSNPLKSPIATNHNNNIYNNRSEVIETQSERMENGVVVSTIDGTEKINNKRLKLL